MGILIDFGNAGESSAQCPTDELMTTLGLMMLANLERKLPSLYNNTIMLLFAITFWKKCKWKMGPYEVSNFISFFMCEFMENGIHEYKFIDIYIFLIDIDIFEVPRQWFIK